MGLFRPTTPSVDRVVRMSELAFTTASTVAPCRLFAAQMTPSRLRLRTRIRLRSPHQRMQASPHCLDASADVPSPKEPLAHGVALGCSFDWSTSGAPDSPRMPSLG